MATNVTTNSSQINIVGQNLSQVNISGRNVRQTATQIADTRQSNRQTVIIGGRGTLSGGSGSGSSSGRRTDIVAIAFRRIGGRRIIVAFTIIGSANPCRRFLRFGARLEPALTCLQNNGFRRVSQRDGVIVLVRHR
jgi:hypothetical protein